MVVWEQVCTSGQLGATTATLSPSWRPRSTREEPNLWLRLLTNDFFPTNCKM